jgi:hypothetical protein
MKKILISLCVLILGFTMNAQDSIQLSTTTIKNTTTTTSYFPYFEFGTDTTMYRITAEYLMPWKYGGSSLVYPRSTAYNLSLGLEGGFSGYKFIVYGKSYFQDDIYLGSAKRLHLDGINGTSCYIRYSGGQMVFYDPIEGSKTLSELAAYDSAEVRTEELSFIPLIPIFEPVPQLGRTYYSKDDSVLYICNDGTTWTELGSGGGTGVVDTAGGQANTYLAYWVDTDILDGEAELAYNATDNELTVGNVITTEGLYLSQFDTDVADTVALILYKMTGLVDTATLVDAAAGWEIDLIPYREFYNESWLREALPLPYPNLGTDEAHGQERREINAKFAYYQIEFELERIHRYLHRFWIQKNWMWVIIGLLVCGFIYQQIQINKLKKNA